MCLTPRVQSRRVGGLGVTLGSLVPRRRAPLRLRGAAQGCQEQQGDESRHGAVSGQGEEAPIGASRPHPIAWWGSYSPVGAQPRCSSRSGMSPPTPNPTGERFRIYRIVATPIYRIAIPPPQAGPRSSQSIPVNSGETPAPLPLPAPRPQTPPGMRVEASHPKTQTRHVDPTARGAARPPPYLHRDPAGGNQAAAGLGELWLCAAPAPPFF